MDRKKSIHILNIMFRKIQQLYVLYVLYYIDLNLNISPNQHAERYRENNQDDICKSEE